MQTQSHLKNTTVLENYVCIYPFIVKRVILFVSYIKITNKLLSDHFFLNQYLFFGDYFSVYKCTTNWLSIPACHPS